MARRTWILIVAATLLDGILAGVTTEFWSACPRGTKLVLWRGQTIAGRRI